jgi:hypothetical protein
MGMFDTIYVHAELPLTEELRKLDIKWDEMDFQTKSLENCMSTYEITREGDLVAYNDAWWEDNSLNREKVKVPCHGKILFYNYIEDMDGHDWFIDFNAYFSYGKLDKIELENLDKTPVQVRLARESFWEHEAAERKKKLSYKIRKVLINVPGYSLLLRKMGKWAHWLGDKVYMISIRWS